LRSVEEQKEAACRKAVELVEKGQVIGLGSGSTVAYFVKLLAGEERSRGLGARVISTSFQVHYLAVEEGLRVATLDEYPEPDLVVDGADEITLSLDMIKGGGAALVREKILASAAKRVAIVADASKVVGRLGERHPVPVEVIPMAASHLLRVLAQRLGARGRIRVSGGKVGPVVTDNGNFVLDLELGPIGDPARLERELKLLPGVVETGLFTGLADLAYVANEVSVRELVRR